MCHWTPLTSTLNNLFQTRSMGRYNTGPLHREIKIYARNIDIYSTYKYVIGTKSEKGLMNI